MNTGALRKLRNHYKRSCRKPGLAIRAAGIRDFLCGDGGLTPFISNVIDPPPPPKRGTRYSLEERQMLRQLFLDGVSVFDASKAMSRTPRSLAEILRHEMGRFEWVNEVRRAERKPKRKYVLKARAQRPTPDDPMRAQFRVTGNFEAPGRAVTERAFCGTRAEADEVFERYASGLMGCAVVARSIELRAHFSNGSSRWVSA